MKWEKAMAGHGLTEQTVSNSVRKRIEEYREFEEKLDQQRQLRKSRDLNEKQAKKIDSRIATLESGILGMDAKLVKDMDRLIKNKDRYREMATRLPRKTSKTQPPAAATTTAVAATGATVPAAAATEPAKPAATKKIETPPSPNPPGKKKEEPKGEKKGNGWGMAIGITLFVLTVGTVGYFKFFKNK